MAQTGFTPIQLYFSSTTTNAPLAANLANGELAINITDGKLFYKDNASAVQVIAWKVTPTTAGGTGLISYTAGDLPYYASGTTLSKLGIGASTTVITSSGSAPQWTAQSSLSVGEASNLKSNATTGKMQITGPTAASTRVMTIPDANFTAARTDAAQTFAGAQTMSAYGAGIATFSSAGLISSTATTGTGNVMLVRSYSLSVNTAILTVAYTDANFASLAITITAASNVTNAAGQIVYYLRGATGVTGSIIATGTLASNMTAEFTWTHTTTGSRTSTLIMNATGGGIVANISVVTTANAPTLTWT